MMDLLLAVIKVMPRSYKELLRSRTIAWLHKDRHIRTGNVDG